MINKESLKYDYIYGWLKIICKQIIRLTLSALIYTSACMYLHRQSITETDLLISGELVGECLLGDALVEAEGSAAGFGDHG